MFSNFTSVRLTVAASVLAMFALCGTAGADDTKLSTSNKWRVEVSGGAESDGTINLRLTPQEGTATDVVATIKKGRGENDIAKDLRDALRTSLGKDAYHIATDDGEDVLVKKRGKSTDFALSLVESTVKGVRLNFQKE